MPTASWTASTSLHCSCRNEPHARSGWTLISRRRLSTKVEGRLHRRGLDGTKPSNRDHSGHLNRRASRRTRPSRCGKSAESANRNRLPVRTVSSDGEQRPGTARHPRGATAGRFDRWPFESPAHPRPMPDPRTSTSRSRPMWMSLRIAGMRRPHLLTWMRHHHTIGRPPGPTHMPGAQTPHGTSLGLVFRKHTLRY